MQTKRVAVVGCGFWSRFQIPAWYEVPGVRVSATVSRNPDRARRACELARADAWYTDLEEMLDKHECDLVDIVSSVEAHREQVELCARRGVPVICQKPMADTFEDCVAMVEACREADVWFGIHENWRYQAPIQALGRLLDSETIGRVFRARLTFSCSFPVFENQPALAEASRFIVSDVGSHLLDAARFLFGEVESLFATVSRGNPGIKGEDVATILLKTVSGAAVTIELSYASRMENEAFPQTFAVIEGTAGSIELRRDFEIRVTDNLGTRQVFATPHHYPWADPDYAIVHASIVGCHTDLFQAFCEGRPAPTSGRDNLRTMELVFGAYESAETGSVFVPKLPRHG